MSARLPLAALALLIGAHAAFAGELLDLASTPPEITAYARGASRAGYFGDRLAAPAAPVDLSGDGRPDLILSAWMADGPPTSFRPDAGEAHVRFGPIATGTTMDLASQPADVTVFGARAGDFLYAQWGGDLDGDGRPDLLLNAPEEDGVGGSRTNAGAALVLCGPFAPGTVIDLATRAPDFVVRGARAGDDLNARNPVDVDGDGYLDMILVASYGDGPGSTRTDAGEAYVLRGPFARGTSIDLASATPLVHVTGADAFDTMSWAEGGDLNGDGRTDLAIGVYGASGAGNAHPYAGEVNVLYAPLRASYDLAAGADLVVYGDADEDSLGGLLTTGDLDGDGELDLVIGACCTSGPDGSRPYAGATYGFFSPLPRGTRLAGEADLIVWGANEEDSLRYPILGKLSPDECDDLAIGADFSSGPDGSRPESGQIFVIDGPFSRGQVIDLATGAADLAVWGAEGAGGGDFGDLLGIASIGDVTGDGRVDLVASAQFADGPSNARPDSGEVYVVEGGCRHLPAQQPIVTPSTDTLYCLWPPNHRLACFTKSDFDPRIAIECAGDYTWRLAGCASDQDRGQGGDDCVVEPGGGGICVRAERNGSGAADGRRYFVSIIATDACGNDGAPVVIGAIHVPHDQPPQGRCRAGDR